MGAMRLALTVLVLAWMASVAAADPITRYWRVRVSISDRVESHATSQYEGLDDVLNDNASYSFVVGTTDDDLAGNAFAISQDDSRDLRGVEGTGSSHEKQTFTTKSNSLKKFRMIDGNLDPKNSHTDCLIQSDSWECTVHIQFAAQESWDPNPLGGPPTATLAGALGRFGGGIGLHANENWSHLTRLPHDRFTMTSDHTIATGSNSNTQKVTVDIEPLSAVGYEAVFVPDAGYEQWLPEGPPVAPSTHQPATIGLHLERRDARTHAVVAKSFRANFILDSSRLVGDCMNYPAAGSSPPDKPDVYFEAAKNTSGTVTRDELSLDLANGKGGAAVVVSSRDWGGYAKLRAHVVVADGAHS
ncbi:hypothetical protein BH11MYX2_BH11MYX2_09020 [soil metagenome]